MASAIENSTIVHVESGGVGEVPQIGDSLDVKAYVSLGELSPEGVEVLRVCGSPTIG